MRNIYISFIILFAVTFSSCSHIYIPALYHQDITYQPKPASWDTVKHATYISAAYNSYGGANFSDDLESGQLNISQAYTGKNFNIAYNVFGVAGNYVREIPDSIKGADNFTSKFFGAVGGRVSANLYSHSGRVDFRYLGVEAAYSHEFGAYADFRRSIANNPNAYSDTRTDLVTLGATSEILWHRKRDDNFENGFRLFVGGTFGRNYPMVEGVLVPGSTDSFSQPFAKVSYFFRYKKYFGTAEFGDGLLIRFGLKF